MSNKVRRVAGFLQCMVFLAMAATGIASAGQEKPSVPPPVPTHADAAIILAKYSGFFDRYVDENASLNECVAFLNRTGIYFGLLEVVNGTEFTQKDCARAMGQVSLVLHGEAEYAGGKVKLPNGIATWEDFCIMNDVNFVDAYQAMLGTVRLKRIESGE